MRREHPRCVAIAYAGHQRCRRRAAPKRGAGVLCGRHATAWAMAIVADRRRPWVLHWLAGARWESGREGEALVNSWRGRRAA
jgi:hypothetical protein